MLLLKYATRGRPAWFQKTIQNIISTIAVNEFQILVSADQDDPTMHNQEMVDFCKQNHATLVCGMSESKIDAINRDMEFADPDWTWLINMSDDMKFVRPGWDAMMAHSIKQVWGDSLDFFAHFNDGYVGDKLPTMSIMGRKYYERDNYIYHPSYKSFSCDAEAMYVAQMRQRHHYFPEVYFLHQHPSNTPHPNDETYTINSLHTPHDTKNYFQRLSRYFDEPEGQEILRARPELKTYL